MSIMYLIIQATGLHSLSELCVQVFHLDFTRQTLHRSPMAIETESVVSL